MPKLTNSKLFEQRYATICSFKSECNFLRNFIHHVHSSIIEIKRPAASIFRDIQIAQLFKIIYSMMFNINPLQFVSSLSCAKPKYFHIFHRYLNKVADLVIVTSLINEADIKLKLTFVSENFALL